MEQQQSLKQKRGGRIALIAVIIVSVLALLGFAGYSLRNMYRYESAVSLLREARYTEAAEAFEELRDYRDAASYLLYSRAAAAGEDGRFGLAADNLKALNGFSDSAILSAYYQARAYEEASLYENALALYTSFSLYRDAGERAAQLPGKILERDYQAACALQEQGKDQAAIRAFEALKGYRDSEERIAFIRAAMDERKKAAAYADADQNEKNGQLKKAREGFLALGDYRDSADRAVQILDRINAAAYADADQDEKNGQLKKAREGFLALGDYQDSADRAAQILNWINAAAYEAADAAERQGDSIKAYSGFLELGDFADSRDRAAALFQPARYQTALQRADRGQYKEARSIFAELGDYLDSAQKAETLWISESTAMQRLGSGLASYKLGDRYGLANLNTNRVTVANYESMDAFNRFGLARVRRAGQYGFIDDAGNEVIEAVYVSADEYDAGGFCRVQDKSGMYGYIDRTGKRAIPCQYSAITAFSGNVCLARTGNGIGLLNRNGEALTDLTYRRLGDQSANSRSLSVPKADNNGRLTAQRADGLYVLMSAQYQVLGEDAWEEIGEFREGLARVRSGREYGFINMNGELAIAPEWPDADSFYGGMCAVTAKDGRRGFINQTGELAIPAIYSRTGHFSGGYAAVYLPGVGWYMIDKQGVNTRFAVAPYERAMADLESGDYDAAAAGFKSLGDYGDAYDQMLESYYRKALDMRESGNLQEAGQLADRLARVAQYRDSEALSLAIEADLLFEAGKTAEAWKLYAQVEDGMRRHEEDYAKLYADADALLSQEKYDEALSAFQALGGYSDSADRINQAYDGKYATEYAAALALMEAGDYNEAIMAFNALGEYSRAKEMANESRYRGAIACADAGDWSMAELMMSELLTDDSGLVAPVTADIAEVVGKTLAQGGYKDAPAQYWRLRADEAFALKYYAQAWAVYACLPDEYHTHDEDYARLYQEAADHLTAADFDGAEAGFAALGAYSDSPAQVEACQEGRRNAAYETAKALLAGGDYDEASAAFAQLNDYRDCQDMVLECAYQKALAADKAGEWSDAQSGMIALLEDGSAFIAGLDSKWSVKEQCDAILAHPGYRDAAAQVCRLAAEHWFNEKQYAAAWDIFSCLADEYHTRDAEFERLYQEAADKLAAAEFDGAEAGFEALGTYADSAEQAEASREGRRNAAYDAAKALLANDSYDEAATAFAQLGEYRDCTEMVRECAYQKALALDAAGERTQAVQALLALDGYKDTDKHLNRISADELFDRGNYAEAWKVYAGLGVVYHTHDQDYQRMYDEADALLRQKDFAGAEAAFRTLGGYRDAALRADAAVEAGLADTYQRAQALQEQGAFDEAYDLYSSLGAYQNSGDKLLEVAQQKADHLFDEGRFAEAAGVYRLLGSDKALEADYLEAERLLAAGDYQGASAQWLAIPDYRDSRDRNGRMAAALAEKGEYSAALTVYGGDLDWQEAREKVYAIGSDAQKRQDYAVAVAAWTLLGAYRDSGMNLTMDTYAYGDQLYAAGRYDEAAEIFRGMNGFSDTAERARQSAYQAALSVLEAGDYADAQERFGALGKYKSSETMVLEAQYRAALAELDAGKYEDALKAFEGLKQYKESPDYVKAARYAIADRAYQEGRYQESVQGFSEIPGYRDADARWQQARFSLYGEVLAAGRYDEAIAGFEQLAAEGYIPAVEEAFRSHYLKAQALDGQEATEAAYHEYVLAEQHEDAPLQVKAHAYRLGAELQEAARYTEAVTWYEIAGDYEDARAQLYKIGYYYFRTQDWGNAVNAFKTLAGYEDVSENLCRIGQYYEMQSDSLNAFLAYGYAGPDSDGAAKAETLKAALTSQADQAVSQGRRTEAIKVYEVLVRIDPSLYPKLLAADFESFLARKGRIFRIGNTDWKFLAEEKGQLVFIADRVLGTEKYSEIDKWLKNAKTRYFNSDEQKMVSSLWIMSKADVQRYMPGNNDRRTTGANKIWTSSDGRYSNTRQIYQSGGSMDTYDYEYNYNSAGIRPALRLKYSFELYSLITANPSRYAFYDSAKKTARYESEYQKAYTAAMEADMLKRYRRAMTLLERGEFTEASKMFTALEDYQESRRMVQECAYQQALALAAAGQDQEAIAALTALNGYSDSAAQIEAARERIRAKRYREAEALEQAERYADAFDIFADLDMAAYQDSADRAKAVAEKAAEQKRAQDYEEAGNLEKAGQLDEAMTLYRILGDFKDSAEKAKKLKAAIQDRDYGLAVAAIGEERYHDALTLLDSVGVYKNSQDLIVDAKTGVNYQSALANAFSGNLKQAYEAFTALGDYKDSAKKAEIVGNLSRAGKRQKLAEGVLIYEFHDLWGIANLNANIITPVKYTKITFEPNHQYAKEGLAKVFISGGSRNSKYSWENYDYVNMHDVYGYIDMNGREVIPCKFIDITDFNAAGNCTVALVKDEYSGADYEYCRQYYGIMNSKGQTVTNAQWRTMGNSDNNDSRWTSKYSASGWDRNNFKIALPTFSSGRMKVQSGDGLWGFINEQGKILGQVKWKSIGNFSDGLAMVSENVKQSTGYNARTVTKYGFIDEQGRTVGEVCWDAVRDFSQGLAAVQLDGKWGFIDRTNTLVIPCRYAEVNAFKSDGTCDVRNPDGTWIVIDKQGNSAFFGK